MMEEYQFLWEDPGVRYVLVAHRGNLADLDVWDKELNAILLIEDDDEHEAVVDLMKRHGVPVLTHMPRPT